MKVRKAIVGIFLVSICLFSNLMVSAQTIQYEITVTPSGVNDDNYSKKALKNTDGDMFFYITPTYFYPENGAAFYATSRQEQGSAVSQLKYIENGINESRHGYYLNDYAPGNKYYRLHTSYGYSATAQVYSVGRYTP